MADFVPIASTNDIPPGEMTIVDINGQELVIANLGGEFVCFSNTCTHKQGPLGEGMLLGEVVECPFHGGQFNTRTGAVVQGPPTKPIATYPVQITGDSISVAVE
jgi:nitrite reductase/ring-hydroxylating ferredoxin subunit